MNDLTLNIIIVSYFAILIGAFALLFYISTKLKDKSYRVDLFGIVVTITSKDAAQLFALSIAFFVGNSFLGGMFTFAFLVIALLILGRVKRIGSLTDDEKSNQLLSMLSANRKLIGDVIDHIEFLSKDMKAKQQEIQEKEIIKEKLDREIEMKSKEATFWQSLTADQKSLLLDATRSVVSNENKNNFWPGLLLGFLLNILATITWTLLGNPGRDQIIEQIKTLTQMLAK